MTEKYLGKDNLPGYYIKGGWGRNEDTRNIRKKSWNAGGVL